MIRDIRERTFEFAVMTIRFSESLPSTTNSAIVIKQLVRSSSSIGANVEEASAASSKADFAYKMGIALREGRETLYWLRIIRAVYSVTVSNIDPLISEADQITRILGAIVSSARGKRKRLGSMFSFFLFHFSFFIFH